MIAANAVALFDFASYPNLRTIDIDCDNFKHAALKSYLEHFIRKATRKLGRVQLLKIKPDNFDESVCAIASFLAGNKGIQMIVCYTVQNIESSDRWVKLENILLNTVFNMNSLEDLHNNPNHTLWNIFFPGWNSWNDPLGDQREDMAIIARPHTLGAMLHLNGTDRASLQRDEDAVMRYRINIKTVVYYLKGGGAWERKNIKEEERICFLPNLLSFVGTSDPSDDQHIADDARLGAFYNLLRSKVDLLVTIGRSSSA